MIIGSHNSWSFLPVDKWWMRPLAFTARCQRIPVSEQHLCGARCFDLRVRFNKSGIAVIVHGIVEYQPHALQLLCNDLPFLNAQQAYVRVILETRTKRQSTDFQKTMFAKFCKSLEEQFPNIHFWCGRCLYQWQVVYQFSKPEPSCEEQYASVCKPRIIDDWLPILFAKRNNKKIKKTGTSKDILLIDFVDI